MLSAMGKERLDVFNLFSIWFFSYLSMFDYIMKDAFQADK